MKRQTRTQRRLRLVSVLLILCLFVAALCSAPVTVSAEDLLSGSENEPVLTVPIEEVQEVGFGEYAVLEGETEAEPTPVQRLYSEEGDDLYTQVWLNDDGTRTMKLYDHPVKYVTETGAVEDISLDIAASTAAVGSYETKAGLAKTVFPEKITDGISLSGNGVSLKLVPALPETSTDLNATISATDTVKLIDEETVSYTYDSKTKLEYSLTYMGFKEDIVVSEYTGQTQYTFLLETNGLTLVNENGSYFLKDETGEIKATIGDIIIFTADEKNNTMGELTHTVVKENYYYFLTIQLDAEWLSDENTAYPIRIDPTLEISTGTGAIEDVTINSNAGSSGTSGSLYVGYRSDSGIARILMRFPGLNLGGIASASNITNAKVEIRDLMCESTSMDVYGFVFSGNSWTESTANWSNVGPNSFTEMPNAFNSVSYYSGTQQPVSHRYAFDITMAVKSWKTGFYNQSTGIMFRANNDVEYGPDTFYKTFASYNRSEYRPSLSITYTSSSTVTTAQGHFDYVDSSQIAGWAWRSDEPNNPITVRATLANTTTGHYYELNNISASNYRSDLASLGYGNGQHGYYIPMDWNNYHPGNYTIRVYGQNSNGTYTELSSSPRTYTNHGVYRSTALPDFVLKGATQQLSATFDMSSVDVKFSCSVPGIVDVLDTGVVTGKGIGLTYITASFQDPATGAARSDTIHIYGRDSIGLSNGSCYYIMNKASGRFMSLSSASDVDGLNVVTQPRSTSVTSRGNVTVNSCKNITLSSCYSSSGKVLSLDGNNLEISTNMSLATQEFSVIRSEADPNWGLYLIRYGLYYVSQDSSYNVVLTTTPTNYSYWSFMKTDKGNASMISFKYNLTDNVGEYDSSTNSDNFLQAFTSLGYSSNSYRNTTLSNAYSQLQNSDVFLYSGHGDNSALCFVGEGDIGYGMMLVQGGQIITSLPCKYITSLTYNQLNSSRCVFYLGCNTGLDAQNGSSLVDSTYDKGAHFVFGVCDITYCEVDQWLIPFFQQLSSGNNIASAMAYADNAVANNMYPIGGGNYVDGYFNRYYRGDTNQYLSIQ